MANFGWASTFPEFRDAPPDRICESLADLLREVDEQQLRAWQHDVPEIQREVGEVLEREQAAREYHAVLEYELPFETRRTDVALLASGVIVILELKGAETASQAATDQAAAYGRDLRCYHRACHATPVRVVVVPSRARGVIERRGDVVVAGPDAVDQLVSEWDQPGRAKPMEVHEFLDPNAYRPLPSLIAAARELFESKHELRYIHRARAATDPAVEAIRRIAADAARTRTRHLVLVTGVPGSGKTLVGLRLVHSREIDAWAAAGPAGKPTAPAVFLSGNGPLVKVLQYQLRGAGGGGKAFVRGIKDYLASAGNVGRSPGEHIVVFDEAQRAWDANMMEKKHGRGQTGSEPMQIMSVSSRVPEWSVVVALIGTGQEIHEGEEAGIAQWRSASEDAPGSWQVHVPPSVATVFAAGSVPSTAAAALDLGTELRFHGVEDLHRLVERIVGDRSIDGASDLSTRLEGASYHLRITRDPEVARRYLRERYAADAAARFGLLASSRDRDLPDYGVHNDFKSQVRVDGRIGPWFTDDEGVPGRYSCRYLTTCATEFQCQGLELDGVLLAWGTDFIWSGEQWSNQRARPYRKSLVRDPLLLRRNAYRVLLTRAREVTVVFVPQLEVLDGTYARLRGAGFQDLQPSDE